MTLWPSQRWLELAEEKRVCLVRDSAHPLGAAGYARLAEEQFPEAQTTIQAVPLFSEPLQRQSAPQVRFGAHRMA